MHALLVNFAEVRPTKLPPASSSFSVVAGVTICVFILAKSCRVSADLSFCLHRALFVKLGFEEARLLLGVLQF